MTAAVKSTASARTTGRSPATRQVTARSCPSLASSSARSRPQRNSAVSSVVSNPLIAQKSRSQRQCERQHSGNRCGPRSMPRVASRRRLSRESGRPAASSHPAPRPRLWRPGAERVNGRHHERPAEIRVAFDAVASGVPDKPMPLCQIPGIPHRDHLVVIEEVIAHAVDQHAGMPRAVQNSTDNTTTATTVHTRASNDATCSTACRSLTLSR